MSGMIDEIKFDTYKNFLQKIDTYYAVNSADTNLLSEEGRIIDISCIGGLQNGRIDFKVNELIIKSFFHYGEKKQLFVFLNGSLTGKMPQFKRWSYYPMVEGTVLNIADPMYDMYSELKLGWYFGNKKINVRKYLADLIVSVAKFLGISNSSIYIFGSSGGGAATFEIGHYISGCMCIALNPQIKLSDWGYSKTFESIVNVQLEQDSRGDGLQYIVNDKNVVHLFIVNIRSAKDMNQLARIKDELAVEINYGWSYSENNFFWLYDAECEPYLGPHSTQEFPSIFRAIVYLIDNKDKIDDVKQFVITINELWREQWKRQKELRINRTSLITYKKCAESGKRIAIFGAGQLTHMMDKQYLHIGVENPYDISVIFDNNELLDNTYFAGEVKILCPHLNKVEWSEFFVVIMIVKNYEQIMEQLEMCGLDKKDYILYTELFE